MGDHDDDEMLDVINVVFAHNRLHSRFVSPDRYRIKLELVYF